MPTDEPRGGSARPAAMPDAPRYTKSTRPTKVCPVCGRPFAWRKKWERDWERVVYCSERCRRGKGAAGTGGA